MRAVIQRVKKASIIANNKNMGEIGKGLLVLLGIGNDDKKEDLDYMVDKILGLRIFEDNNNKMNLSIKDIKGDIAIVSQFTLYGDVRKGRRPNFMNSANPILAEKYYNMFIDKIKEENMKVITGSFGANMEISLVNDGPVTILMDSKKIF